METNEEQTTSYPSKEQIEHQLAEFCELQDVPPWGEAHVTNRLDDMAIYVHKLVADALEATTTGWEYGVRRAEPHESGIPWYAHTTGDTLEGVAAWKSKHDELAPAACR